MTEPVPPTNVRIETDSGPIPLELVYAGLDDNGVHVWKPPVRVYVRGKSARLRYDAMPPGTTVAVDFGIEGFEPIWGSHG